MSRGARSLRAGAALALAALVLSATAAEPGSGSGVVARVVASPLSLTLRLERAETDVGKRVKATATLTNVGAASLRTATVALRGDPRGLVTDPPKPRSISNLKPGAARSVHWQVCAEAAGNYVLVATADARTNVGTTYEATSPAELLVVQAAKHNGCGGDDDDDD